MAVPQLGIGPGLQQFLNWNINSAQIGDVALQMAGVLSGNGSAFEMANSELGTGPVPPPQAAYQRFQTLQSELSGREQEALARLSEEPKELTEALFDDYHYDFSGGGEPRLVEGGENLEQRLQRLDWERERSGRARDAFESGPVAAGLNLRMDQLQEAIAQERDPARRQELSEQLSETQLNYQAQLGRALLDASLPPAGSAPVADRLRGYLHGLVDDYMEVHRENRQILANDPDGRAIAAYQTQMQAFMQRASQLLQEASQQAFDPNAMRNAALGLS